MVFFGKKYEYCTCPDKGISVGIYTNENHLPVRSPFYWNWAIKNLATEVKSFVILNDTERKRYFKLQVFTDPDLAPVLEVSPLLEYEQKRINDHVTLALPPLIVKIKPGKRHEFKVFQPGFELAPGNYWLRVLLEVDKFKCSSGFLPIAIVSQDN